MVVPFTLNVVKSQWRLLSNTHPLAKGIISYAVIWPTSSLIQQMIEGKNLKTCDWMRCLRFSIFGALYVAPTLYGWVRLSSVMWPQMNLRVGIVKAAVEQISYGPFAGCSFFYGMSLLEGKNNKEAVQEVKDKFPEAYKIGICVWPIIQTINFSVVPEGYRVVYVSVCSLAWTTFLAYMKTKDMHEEGAKQRLSQEKYQPKRIMEQETEQIELKNVESLVLKVKRAFSL